MVNHVTQPINWGDLLRDTMHLSTVAFGAYIRLIGHYWAHEGLPDDDRSLWRITRLDDYRQWIRHRVVLQEFFHDGWKHKRIDEDLAKRTKFRAQQRQKAEHRWAVETLSTTECDTVDHARYLNTAHTDAKSPDGSTSKSLKYNEAGDAMAMPTFSLKESKSLSFLNGEAPPAGQLSPGSQIPNYREIQKKDHQAEKDAKRRKARQAWEAALAQKLGPDDFADAIDILAANPPLADRITDAELRQPGNGATTAPAAILNHVRKAS
jgi:uncharacterized protein YdaU (DUF1376 family)